MPAVPMVTAVWARQIVERLEKDGTNMTPVLRALDLERRRLFRDEARIPFAKHLALMEQAAAITGDDCFAFRSGSTRDMRDAGLLGYVGLSAATLGAALRNIQRYLQVLSEGVRITLEHSGQEVVAHAETVDPFFRANTWMFESGMATLMAWCRTMTGRRLAPLSVTFRHHRQANTAAFGRFFGCPVHFGSPHNTMTFNRDHMDIPLSTADSRLNRLLRTYCEETLARRASVAALNQEVERAIAAHLPAGEAQLDTVATDLGMSKRTLSRRLAEENTSFGEIRERLRRELAEKYLSDPGLTLSHIAYLLGYSEVSAFNHAFRRWTGTTPTVHRSRAA